MLWQTMSTYMMVSCWSLLHDYMCYVGAAAGLQPGYVAGPQVDMPGATAVVDQQAPGMLTAANITSHMLSYCLVCFCTIPSMRLACFCNVSETV